MCFLVNFLKLFRIAFLQNLESFTINYDLAKYLKTLAILIDFA